ncbi:MAG: hypothetical protein DME22_16685 [Verrucomicrobia bacterium]|nr:MAG: hypothetical protein DME22_16685 [Verrucomicrobiota bacterium]
MDENADPSLLDYLNFGSKTATGVLGSLNQPKQIIQQGGGQTNWAVIGGIAAAVIGVLLLVFVVGKK